MATRAIICTKLLEVVDAQLNYEPLDSYFSISSSTDGYPEHMLQVLNDHYGTKEKVRELIMGGNVRTLYQKYTPNPLGYHSASDAQPKVTVVYSRDSASLNDNSYKIINLKERKIHYPYFDYVYKYENGRWHWASNLNDDLIFRSTYSTEEFDE